MRIFSSVKTSFVQDYGIILYSKIDNTRHSLTWFLGILET